MSENVPKIENAPDRLDVIGILYTYVLNLFKKSDLELFIFRLFN